MTDAVCLLSGGQDSTTCLYWALDRYDTVAAVAFDYGQRHRVELEMAAHTAKRTGVQLATIPVEALSSFGAASLTNPKIGNVEIGEARNVYADSRGLPASFVPGRNVLFFTLAAAYGATLGSEIIVTGVCEQDRAGYPDCREEFVDSMQESLRLALDMPDFRIDAPLLLRSKADTWQLADDLGVLSEIVIHTHTCYEGVRGIPKPWGHGCGECGACVERARGYDEFRAATARSL